MAVIDLVPDEISGAPRPFCVGGRPGDFISTAVELCLAVDASIRHAAGRAHRMVLAAALTAIWPRRCDPRNRSPILVPLRADKQMDIRRTVSWHGASLWLPRIDNR